MKNYDEIREKFFTHLLRKTSTRKQAEDYLSRQKIESLEVFDALINEAEDMNLINDAAFAKLFVDGHLSWGNMKIAHELGARGISREDISLALDEADDEVIRAGEIVKRLRKSGIEERKIVNRLLSRGFSRKAVRLASERNQ